MHPFFMIKDQIIKKVLSAQEEKGNSYHFSLMAYIIRNFDDVSPSDLTQLVKCLNFQVRLAISVNPKTPVEALDILKVDTRCNIRLSIAQRKDTPSDILSFLSFDNTESVRLAVAENKNTPNEVLDILSKDTAWLVKETAIKNKNKRTPLLT